MPGGGGFPVCCRGASVACVGVGEPPVARRAAAVLALAVALWMRSAGRGGSDNEVEDVNEDEDEQEVVVFGGRGLRCDAGGCGFMGGGFCCGHGGMDGGHVLGLQVRGGWLGGPGCGLAAWLADLVGSGGGGRRGAGVVAF